jgi:hypothetical protein
MHIVLFFFITVCELEYQNSLDTFIRASIKKKKTENGWELFYSKEQLEYNTFFQK